MGEQPDNPLFAEISQPIVSMLFLSKLCAVKVGICPTAHGVSSLRAGAANAIGARAALAGRDYGLPEDVEALAADALSHRLIPSWRATSEGLGARDLVARLLSHVRPW